MTHARTLIRRAVAKVLAPTENGTYAHVHPSRIDSPSKKNYLKIYCDVDSAESLGTSEPVVYDRVAKLVFVGHLSLPGTGDTVTIEDKMDALCEEVETKLTNASIRLEVPRIGWISLDTTNMDLIIGDPDLKPDHAEVTMGWDANYATEEGVPGAFV